MGAQNKDFGAVSQMDLTSHNILVPSVVQANDSMDNMTFKTGNDVADFLSYPEVKKTQRNKQLWT